MRTLMTIVLWTSVLFSSSSYVYSSEGETPRESEIFISDEKTELFTADPLGYIAKNFDIRKHSSFLEAKEETEFLVSFKCFKGRLTAKFDDHGNLIYHTQKFNNIKVPVEIMSEVYRDFKGWEVVNIDYKAHGKGDSVDKAVYKLTLQKNDQQQLFTKKLNFRKNPLEK
jgi:hypothetical protein